MSEAESPKSGTVLIKKYANRRLYHTERSSYVTLDDLAEMVRDEVAFVVQDAKSGEDITRTVLTQIIFDAENSGQMMLPTNFLREIIRLYGDSMQSVVPGYLEQAMNNFMARQDEIRQSFQSAMSYNPAMAGLEQLSKMNQDWIERSMAMFSATNPMMGTAGTERASKAEPPQAETQKAEPEQSKESAEELKALRSQLEAMQSELSKLVQKK